MEKKKKKLWKFSHKFKIPIFRLKSNTDFFNQNLQMGKDTIFKNSRFLYKNMPYASWIFLNNQTGDQPHHIYSYQYK